MPTKSTCRFSDCEVPAIARGMCGRHYSTWHAQQDHGPCPIDGCSGRRKSPGTPCSRHQTMLQRTGSATTPPQRPAKSDVTECTVDDCDRAVLAKRLCPTHYWRLRKYGSTDKPPRRASRARWRLDGNGYRIKYWPDHPCAQKGGKVLEHHVVMAELIGRRLRPEETVHHRNGIRHDNRPENLELWASRHPRGQRVTDLVAFAHEILDAYGDHESVRSAGTR